jgi:chromosome condensin MukBEF complex kleisin-like MukF subunit
MKVTLHSSYLAALTQILVITNSIDEVFTINEVSSVTAHESHSFISSALANLHMTNDFMQSFVTKDVAVHVDSDANALGYIRTYINDDGNAAFAHALILGV